MFAASRPISGAMSLAASEQPLTLPTPEATPRPPAPVLSVPVVVGTRPEAIKVAPVILALRESDCLRPIVISTGQHHRMVREIFDLAGITTDVELWAGDARSRLNDRVAAVMGRFEDFAREWFDDDGSAIASGPDVVAGRYPLAVLVHGDTSSALAAALAAFHLRIPVMHLEAGLRTGGSNLTPFPEELNRQLISCIACFHFAPTATNQENLVRENVPTHQVFVTGNTGIDALHWASRLELSFSDPELQDLERSQERVVVVTAHRRENWGAGLAGIASGVARLSRSHPDVRFVVPLHPNPRVREQLGDPLRELPNVLLTEPLGYAEFARLLGRSYLVITDSGGIQEEAPSLNKPVLVARNSTERIEGVEAGTLRVVGTDPDLIAAEGSRLLGDEAAYADMAQAINPYGDGRAAARIVTSLENLYRGGEPPQQFGSGYTRQAVLEAAGYEHGLDPEWVPSGERGESHEHQAGDPLWPS
jgi:UDP-N-acetylglucosamine 2-epimerase (non-hydrolysing)